jgi:hypothetical protein
MPMPTPDPPLRCSLSRSVPSTPAYVAVSSMMSASKRVIAPAVGASIKRPSDAASNDAVDGAVNVARKERGVDFAVVSNLMAPLPTVYGPVHP